MYICNKCGQTTKSLPTYSELRPIGDTSVSETMTQWEHYCGGDFEKAVKCKTCGKWLPEDEVMPFTQMCRDCIEGYAESFEVVKKCAEYSPCTETVEIDSFLFWLFGRRSEDISGVLWAHALKAFEEIPTERSKMRNAAKEWALDDEVWFSHNISEMIKDGIINEH